MRSNLFDEMLSSYIKDNKLHLYKKTVHFLTSQEDEPYNDTYILTLSQLGTLKSISKDKFDDGRFDDEFLNLLTPFRGRCSLVMVNKPDCCSLIRVVITNSSKEERVTLDKFMSKNVGKYYKYIRQTLDPTGKDGEKVLDIKHVVKLSREFKLDKSKDLSIIFGS